MVSIPDLQDHITHTLDELDRVDLLTWDDAIPNDEIWVKIGGDGGGGTTKFYYQILNTEKCNSRRNSTVFCAYAADESLPNLHIALDRFVNQVNGLLTATWRDKKIVPWLCADYLLICKLLGLQGASATYPCMLCHAKRGKLDEAEEDEQRSLESIHTDFERVEAKAFTVEAKQQNHSVSHQPFFKIPLEQVCIPGLHVSLGLWNKFYSLLENDVGKLGNLIVDKLAEEDENSEEEKNQVWQTCQGNQGVTEAS
ncbi:uncharacterized protein [Amphiura filiformis]|uniref:uncharacterized protein n=1 Tax=Amphiura filiformis TaxID=82378 RepID=UPI003B20BC2F